MKEKENSNNGNDGGDENKTMVEVLLDLQRLEPEYYTDQTIKNLLLVINLLSLYFFLAIYKHIQSIYNICFS